MHRIRNEKAERLSRRTVLTALAGLGVGTATFHRALAAQAAQAGAVTKEMIKQAEWIAGLELTEDERTRTARSVEQSLRSFAELRKVDVGYDVPPALTFFPAPPRPAAAVKRNQATPVETPVVRRPESAEQLAFLSVVELSALIRSRQISSTELTKLYLERLKRFDPLLKCVVTLTEDVALKQAAAGRSRDRRRALSRRAPRDSLGREGPDRLSRLSHHLGSDALQDAGDRWKGHGGCPAGRGRRGDGREAFPRCPCHGRSHGSAAAPAARGTREPGPAVRRQARHPQQPRDSSASRSAAKPWAASSRPAARAGPPVCDRLSAA